MVLRLAVDRVKLPVVEASSAAVKAPVSRPPVLVTVMVLEFPALWSGYPKLAAVKLEELPVREML
jgi:hypothetical protein